MSNDQWLILWDIDGTLLHKAVREHIVAIYQALEDVFGPQKMDVMFDPGRGGMTEGQIVKEILTENGLSMEQIESGLPKFQASLYDFYQPEDLRPNVIAGIPDVLGHVQASDRLHHSFVTGNFEPIARKKISSAGLDGWFEGATTGAFATDSDDRNELPPIARGRAGQLLNAGAPWPQERTLIIGDTPRDIECARADRCQVIGVTTGHFAAEQLQAADGIAANSTELLAQITRITDG